MLLNLLDVTYFSKSYFFYKRRPICISQDQVLQAQVLDYVLCALFFVMNKEKDEESFQQYF